MNRLLCTLLILLGACGAVETVATGADDVDHPGQCCWVWWRGEGNNGVRECVREFIAEQDNRISDCYDITCNYRPTEAWNEVICLPGSDEWTAPGLGDPRTVVVGRDPADDLEGGRASSDDL